MDETTGAERLARVIRRTVELSVPFVVHVELTHRCNLRCRHCYLPSHDGREASGADWVALMPRLAAQGTLFVIVSGGEPFVRPDALTIMEAVRGAGLALRVLTNGTLLGPDEIGALARLCPASVEISVLGGSAAVHDEVTGVAGSFDRAVGALRGLAEAGVRTVVKVPVMRANWRDFASIESLAAETGSRLRYDICISQRLDGDEGPLDERLTEGELQAFLTERGVLDALEPALPLRVVDGDAVPCGAGRNAFSVAPDGTVHPCVALRVPLGNVFTDPWERIRKHPALVELRGQRMRDLDECASCDLASVCGRCAGVALLETGRADGPSPSACRLGRSLARLTGRTAKEP